MAQTIVEGLRRQATADSRDTGDDGDAEDEDFEPKTPRGGGQKRRTPWENLLSVRFFTSLPSRSKF